MKPIISWSLFALIIATLLFGIFKPPECDELKEQFPECYSMVRTSYDCICGKVIETSYGTKMIKNTLTNSNTYTVTTGKKNGECTCVDAPLRWRMYP
tara:strand:- start:163 stop:453 length:291 start_codon:yes stop_codon:yes gene_type:complete